MGPGPLRTARGAGREAEADFLATVFFAAGFLRTLLLVPEADARGLDPDPPEPDLRDRAGEDVRVAMMVNLLAVHTSHISPTPNRSITMFRRPNQLKSHWRVCWAPLRRPGHHLAPGLEAGI